MGSTVKVMWRLQYGLCDLFVFKDMSGNFCKVGCYSRGSGDKEIWRETWSKNQYMEVTEILQVELKFKLIPVLYHQTYTIVGSYWNGLKCIIKHPGFNVHRQTNKLLFYLFFFFFWDAVTGGGDFCLHPNKLDLFREIAHLQTRLREIEHV